MRVVYAAGPKFKQSAGEWFVPGMHNTSPGVEFIPDLYSAADASKKWKNENNKMALTTNK
jgi:hypothetical protein